MANTPCKVEHVSREVLERRLLTTLHEGNRVAVLLEEKDLWLLINALEGDGGVEPMSMSADLRKLGEAAFGK